MRQENDLGHDPIGKLVWRVAIPSMLAQFVSVLYSIVDRMYIGNIAGIGEIALAGVGVCGPVITMVGSVASLIGVGGAPLMSIRLGEGRKEAARDIVANAFLMLCVFGLALTGLLFAVRRPMLLFFGASEATIPYAETYFSWYLIGTVFSLLATGMSQYIICQGYAKIAMCSVILGAVLNIVLDPVFIFALGFGVAGAAIATVLSQLASCCFVLRFLFGPWPPISIRFGGYQARIMGRILAVGFTPFAIIAVDNIMIIAMNMVLQQYGGPGRGDLLVTCATITQSFMLVVTMPLGGISGGTQSILSYNYGAKHIRRVRQAQRRIIGLCVGYAAILQLLAWVAGPAFVRLFTADAEVAREAVRAIRVCTLMLLPLGVQYEIVDGFTAMGLVRYSLPLSFWRKFVYFVALFVCPALFGAQAAFFAEPISDLLGPIVTVTVYLIAMRPVLKRRLLAPEPAETQGKTG